MPSPLYLLAYLIPFLLSFTVHESAHAYTAFRLGDRTGYRLGRISLNPLRHIDLVGTIIVPIASTLFLGMPYGWAKSVPCDPNNFLNPRRDFAICAAAGPISNFVMALMWALAMKGLFMASALGFLSPDISSFAIVMCSAGITINLGQGILNFLPIPPLDGSMVVRGLIPESAVESFDRLALLTPGLFYILYENELLDELLAHTAGISERLLYWSLGLQMLSLRIVTPKNEAEINSDNELENTAPNAFTPMREHKASEQVPQLTIACPEPSKSLTCGKPM